MSMERFAGFGQNFSATGLIAIIIYLLNFSHKGKSFQSTSKPISILLMLLIVAIYKYD